VWKESEPFKTRSHPASVILHPSLRSLQFRPMQIRYTPSVEDAVSVQRIGGAAPTWAMFIFIVLLSLMFLVAMFLINHGFAVIGWSWLSLSVAMGIATYELPRVQLRRSFRATPSARGEIVLTISDKGTEASFATGRTRLDGERTPGTKNPPASSYCMFHRLVIVGYRRERCRSSKSTNCVQCCETRFPLQSETRVSLRGGQPKGFLDWF
jgi:hypothetical protein